MSDQRLNQFFSDFLFTNLSALNCFLVHVELKKRKNKHFVGTFIMQFIVMTRAQHKGPQAKVRKSAGKSNAIERVGQRVVNLSSLNGKPVFGSSAENQVSFDAHREVGNSVAPVTAR